MNKIIYDLLDTLEQKGFEAYLVGGYVRDYLLGEKSHDVDICTSALPNDFAQIWHLKPNIFGGINFQQENFNITITSWRQDLDYKKGFPQKVVFGVGIDTDLKRRDFTINAIYMDKNENIVAGANYLEDLKTKTLRMIGDPYERIKEDPTRIIRAIRFTVDLDFKMEENLLKVIKENLNLLNNISLRRKLKEIHKIKNKKAYEKFLKK